MPYLTLALVPVPLYAMKEPFAVLGVLACLGVATVVLYLTASVLSKEIKDGCGNSKQTRCWFGFHTLPTHTGLN